MRQLKTDRTTNYPDSVGIKVLVSIPGKEPKLAEVLPEHKGTHSRLEESVQHTSHHYVIIYRKTNCHEDFLPYYAMNVCISRHFSPLTLLPYKIKH